MKKIIILVLIVGAVITVSVMVLLAIASNNEQTFTHKNYEADGTQIKNINIDVKDRQIEVSLSEDNQIHINYSESDKEYYDISISDDNVLMMTTVNNKEWSDYISSKPAIENRKISLQIPNSLLASLKLSTTNDDIQLSSLNVSGDITLSSNKGNISFDKIDAGNRIILTGKDGNIKGSIVGGYDDYAIACKIKKGESNLPAEKKGGSKELSINANNGDVEIDFCK